MSVFWSVYRYEFRMSIRRKGFWVAYGIVFFFYLYALFTGSGKLEVAHLSTNELWNDSAHTAFALNLFLPVIAGISAADRLIRDRQYSVDEVLRSTRLKNGTYVLGKYLGVLSSLALPVFVFLMLAQAYVVVLGAPPILLGMCAVCFVVLVFPAYAFVTAFSLVCPLVMPVRVYQVLFTGYWFWGNFLSPKVIPTLSGTLLQAGGKVAMEGLFGVSYGTDTPWTRMDVVWNFGLLLVCIAAALVFADQYLKRKNRLA